VHPGSHVLLRIAFRHRACSQSFNRALAGEFNTIFSGVGSLMAARTVLLVEDYADTRELFKILLEAEGFKVFAVESGPDALEAAVKSLPDIIIMDMSLPGMDGCQVTRQLRTLPGFATVPIIACTAHNQWEWRAKAILAGCTDFIRKPIDFGALNTAIQRALPNTP
jgi:CheY-like chemotaxis protein